VEQRGVWGVAFVHVSARVHSVIAYRGIHLIPVEVHTRLSPVVIALREGWCCNVKN
jgi:hypothetical protein